MSFALRALRAARPMAAVRAAARPAARPAVARMFSAPTDGDDYEEPGLNPAREFDMDTEIEAGVMAPTLVNTLEWTLSSPPPIHQFEEPPIIVEIDGLDN